MKIPFNHHQHPRIRKKLHLELDPRRYWVILLSFFVLGLAAELIYFSFVFRQTQDNIDAPATPTLETNALQIRTMNRTLADIEAALRTRTGTPAAASSQIDSSVVQ